MSKIMPNTSYLKRDKIIDHLITWIAYYNNQMDEYKQYPEFVKVLKEKVNALDHTLSYIRTLTIHRIS